MKIIDGRRALIGGLLAVPLMRPWLAFGQGVSPGSPAFLRLYQTGVSVGNGADTTEDVLQVYTLPAGTLAGVGDTLRFAAWGTLAGSTDSKTVRVRIGGGASFGTLTATLAPQITWRIEATVVKTGSGTQAVSAVSFVNGNSQNGSTLPSGASTAMNDAVSNQLQVSGQNNTTASAGSITCSGYIVDLVRGT